jgi:Fe2+ transport protein
MNRLITTRAGALARRAAAGLAVTALAAGCASADKQASTSSSGSATTSSSSSMAGMNMSGSSTTSSTSKAAAKDFAAVAGVKPVPTQVLGIGDWQGMKITAQAMTAVPFLVYNGTSERMVKPPHNVSFHLMVLLNDAQTGVPIPYATVWATITKADKIVFDERQWPMISRYMGPHYGNDVALPGAGTYRLTLLISPPVSARHVEYQHVWLKPHRVSFTFHWKPVT